jgi:Tfp pilus assembly protein PilO
MNPLPARIVAILRRYPYGVACGVLTLAAGLGAWYFSSQNEELDLVRQERGKEYDAMLALLVGGSTQRQELAGAREATRRIEENLVIESNLAENAFYFYKFEEQTKARLPELHPLSSPTASTSPLYRRVPYTLRVTGTFEQVTAFLQAIETGPRLANITAFGFTRRDPTGGEIALDLSLELLGKK